MIKRDTEIVARYDLLKDRQGNFRNRWSLISKFFAPTRYGLLQDTTVNAGQNIMRDVFDSTGHFAADLFGNFISGKVISPAEKWFGIRAGDSELKKEDEVKEWFEECRDRQLGDYDASNFYTEATEMIKDYGVFATGSLCGHERPQLPHEPPAYRYRGSYFACQPIGRYVISENAIGEVDTEMFEQKISARAALARWPKAEFSDSLRQAFINQKDDEFDFIYAVTPREQKSRQGQFGNKAMPWAAKWIEKLSGVIMEETGFNEFPFTSARYGKRWGETYGRGFGELALHDAQTLNLAKQMGLEDFALKIRPAIMARENSVTGTLRIKPAGLTTINTHGQPLQNVIQPWQTGSHPEVGAIKEEALRQSIMQIFYVSQIVKLLEVENLKEMTATAYTGTLNLLFGLLGPVYGALENSLRHRVESDFFRLYRERVFSPPPDILLERGGGFQIEFQNPLSRARRMGEVEAIDASLMRIRPIAEAEMALKGYSEVFDWINVDETAQKIFDVTGYPASCANSRMEVEQIRAARAEAQKQKMQQEQIAMMADTASKVTPAIQAVGNMQQQQRAA